MAPNRPPSVRTSSFSTLRRHSTAQGPPSPTFSEATNASAMDFGSNGPQTIITRAHLKISQQAYEDLVNSSANYRTALLAMSRAAAAFADSMGRCSSLKGPSYEASTRLQAASGLHHLIGNHWHVLAETLDNSFEKPLREQLDAYRGAIAERSASYERALHEKSQVIRATEAHSMNRKQRNLQSFREALTVLQRQVDELDALKANHYQEIIEHEEEVWDAVQGKVCVVIRSTMDVFDRFTAKASDPVIEPMLQSVPDPFDSYGPPQAEDQIFSILAPLSIMTNVPSSTPSSMTGSPEPDSFRVLPSSGGSQKNTWLPTSNNGMIFSSGSAEWTAASSPSSGRPRSISPPPSQTARSRPTSPPNHRNSDSKSRLTLAIIDERRPSQSTSGTTTPRSSSCDSNGLSPHPGPAVDDWTFSDRQSADEKTDDSATPRNSSFFPSPEIRPQLTDPKLEPPPRRAGGSAHLPLVT